MTEPTGKLERAEELALRQEYEARREELDALAASVKLICEAMLRAHGVPYHSVKARVKSLPSVLDKIVRKHYKSLVAEVKDLVGLRVILLYPSHVDTTVRLLQKEFNVVDRVDKRPQPDSQQFGYSSVHLVCTLEGTPRSALLEYARLLQTPFEVQVRTILQEAWAEIEHRLVYKSEVETPKEIRRLITRLSGSLEIADEQFEEIFDKREKYVEKLKASDLGGLRDEPLNRDSLLELIRRKYPWAEGWEKINEEKVEFFLTALLSELQHLGVTTVRQLLSLLEKWYDAVYKESERTYLIVTGQAKPEPGQEARFAMQPEAKAWCERTRQFYIPIGQIRQVLKHEFPQYQPSKPKKP